MNILSRRGLVHVGMDVSKDWIAVAVLPPEGNVATVDKIPAADDDVRKLIKRLGRPSGLYACYEAGPTGYGLYRLLSELGVRCDVVAPSLVPKGPGDRVKTDRRDSRRLAGLHRAGELTPIGVPSPAEEAVRDLCRTRGDMVEDLTRARNRIGKFLLRHGRVYRAGSTWTSQHRKWLSAQRFDDRALELTFAHYLSTVEVRDRALDEVEADLAGYFRTEPFAEAVSRIGAYKGFTHLGALCIGAEVFDWRRFPGARPFMNFTGLTCSEHSTGSREHRGWITKAGNSHLRAQLCEAAWSYNHPPRVGVDLHIRQEQASAETVARSWRAQTRLSARFRTLAARKNVKSVAAAAVARELAGFLWAEMTASQ